MESGQTSGSGWERVGSTPAGDLGAARLCVHWAAQIPAAIGNTLVPPQPDFGHLSLEWNPALGALVGSPTPHELSSRAGLRVADLTLLHVTENGQLIDELPLHGKTLDAGMHWLATSIREHVGAQLGDPLARPDHELPQHSAADGGALRLVPIAAFEELSRWFGNADRVLQPIRIGTEGSAPVRCWPHHLDIATLVTLDGPETKKSAEEARSFGVGLSPGDGSRDCPYWYVTPWPYPATEQLPHLDGAGSWHTDGWVGAVLPGTELDARADSQAQLEQVQAFLRSAIAACQSLLAD